MTKRVFLAELREALEGELPSQEIEGNIRYYDSYFSESGKSEQEVCEELGEPRLIARTLIDSFAASKGPMADYYKEQARDEYSRETSRSDDGYPEDGMAGGEKWYDKLFRYVMIAAVAVIIGAVLLFVLRVAITIVIPVVLIIFIVRVFMDLFRRF